MAPSHLYSGRSFPLPSWLCPSSHRAQLSAELAGNVLPEAGTSPTELRGSWAFLASALGMTLLSHHVSQELRAAAHPSGGQRGCGFKHHSKGKDSPLVVGRVGGGHAGLQSPLGGALGTPPASHQGRRRQMRGEGVAPREGPRQGPGTSTCGAGSAAPGLEGSVLGCVLVGVGVLLSHTKPCAETPHSCCLGFLFQMHSCPRVTRETAWNLAPHSRNSGRDLTKVPSLYLPTISLWGKEATG